MSTSVGAIDLGLRVNKNDFGRELNGIGKYAAGQAKSAFAGVGKVLGSVIAAGSVVAFTKSCIELGSNLAEVQNVVDVTFGSMSNDINTFAKNAIAQFGLSETSAKQYSSTMGAMLKSMGFTTKSALEMSKSITGLSADMASFYNLDNQTAFEKIRSGISGETEPLKQLGINMSVANLEAYALSKGIKTAYSAMGQQQQTLLRYNYLMSATADAQGDFARTSGGWANQVRILKENFNTFKAELGQAFIAVATPVISVLNSIIEKLIQAATAFRSFIDSITGNDSTAQSSMTKDLTAAANAAVLADNAVAGIGKTAEKTKKTLMSFDEINILSTDDSDSADTVQSVPVNTSGNINSVAVKKSVSDIEKEISNSINRLKKQYNELAKEFEKGFNIGIGGNYKKNLLDIKDDLRDIKSVLADIFDNPHVRAAAASLDKSFAFATGQIVGSAIGIGTTIARNLVGGWNKYLTQNEGFISERIISILGSSEQIALQAGEFATTIAEIFNVFGGETGQQITADIIGIFNNGFLGVLDLSSQLGADLFWSITQPFIDNKDEMKTAIENTLKPLETITGTLKKSVDDTFAAAQVSYDTYIDPMFDNFEAGTSRMSASILGWYNEDMSPVLQNLADNWKDMYEESVQPNIDKCIEIISKFGYAISLIWNNVVAPFVKWFEDKFGVTIADNVGKCGNSIIGFAGIANDNLGNVLDDFNKIMDAIILLLESLGDFKNNWKTGMDAIINGLKGNAIKNIFNQLAADVKEASKKAVNGIIDNINWLISKANEKIRFKMPEMLGGEEFKGFSIPTIPRLAKGGIINQPTLAMVGEAGREAVMPLENNTGWIDELAAKIAMIIMSAGNNNVGTNGDNTPIEIYIEIGGIRFGKVVLDSLNALKKQNGRLKIEF